MSAPRSRARIGASNRRAGADDERDLARWLRANGFPHAERAVRTGYRTAIRTGADHGDITGTPGVVWQVTRRADLEQDAVLTRRLAETAEQQLAAAAELGVLVQRRQRSPDPGRWWAWLPLDVLAWLAVDEVPVNPAVVPANPAVEQVLVSPAVELVPVRVELRHLLPLIRGAGFGLPVVEEAS